MTTDDQIVSLQQLRNKRDRRGNIFLTAGLITVAGISLFLDGKILPPNKSTEPTRIEQTKSLRAIQTENIWIAPQERVLDSFYSPLVPMPYNPKQIMEMNTESKEFSSYVVPIVHGEKVQFFAVQPVIGGEDGNQPLRIMVKEGLVEWNSSESLELSDLVKNRETLHFFNPINYSEAIEEAIMEYNTHSENIAFPVIPYVDGIDRRVHGAKVYAITFYDPDNKETNIGEEEFALMKKVQNEP